MFREEQINLWDTPKGSWKCITTNGTIRRDGALVMGKGNALEARERFPDVDLMLGRLTSLWNVHVFPIPEFGLIGFPTKHNWYENADLGLIRTSCRELAELFDLDTLRGVVYLPRPGVGNGGLSWEIVRPVVAKELEHLGDRIIIVYL